MALIEREALKKRVKQSTVSRPIKAAMQVFIDTVPTIDPIRAAGGCRCVECRYRNEHGHCAHPRHEILPTTYPNDFCSYGKPREAHSDG